MTGKMVLTPEDTATLMLGELVPYLFQTLDQIGLGIGVAPSLEKSTGSFHDCLATSACCFRSHFITSSQERIGKQIVMIANHKVKVQCFNFLEISSFGDCAGN